MLKLGIWDREDHNRKILQKICENYIVQEDYDIRIFCCTGNSEEIKNSEELAFYILENSQDVQGNTLLHNVRAHNPNHYIILILKSAQELLETIKPFVRPSGFLIRPAQKEPTQKLLREIYLDYLQVKKTDNSYFVFRADDGEHCLPYQNILYFESKLKKIFVRTNAQQFSFYASLSELTHQAPPYFCRVYKSFCINIKRVQLVDYPTMTIYMEDGSEIPLSRTYKDTLRNSLALEGKKL